MKGKLRWLSRAFVAGAAMAMLFSTGCVVTTTARPVHVVDREPPPPRYRTVQPRTGYVWVRGHWEWRSNAWRWRAGHWERARTGYTWRAGVWERRGNRYHWVAGAWVAGSSTPHVRVRDHRRHNTRVIDEGAPAYPTQAPPAPRYETPAARTGHVWIRGHYEWRGGQYVWVRGHWERTRANRAWQAGHWEQRGDRYVWVAGRWIESQPKVVVRDHRGSGHQTRVVEEGPDYPTEAPPAAQYETPKPRRGYVWVRGHYQWKGGGYAWVRGHWERAKAGKKWQAGHWEKRGNRYVWVAGRWVDSRGRVRVRAR